MKGRNLYFDNSSTSYPKPSAVIDTLTGFYNEPIGSYGRSMDNRTLSFSSKVEELRETLGEIIGTKLIENIVFTKNATEGSNLILLGLELKNTTIAVSPLEHNAIARPLQTIKERNNINIITLPSDENGIINIEELGKLDLSNCSLSIINIESNVNGVVQPISTIAPILKDKGCDIMLDASQHLDAFSHLYIDSLDIDYLILTGHKKLMGTTGSGAMFIRDPHKVKPVFFGGNGYKSQELEPAEVMPYRYEVGTIDILSLNALLSAIMNAPEKTLKRETWLQLIEDLRLLDCRVLSSGKGNEDLQGGCFSIVPYNRNISDTATKLYYKYDIVCRDGLQCSPLAHKTLGSYPYGTIRFSPNFFYHNEDDIDYLYNSIKNVLQRG